MRDALVEVMGVQRKGLLMAGFVGKAERRPRSSPAEHRIERTSAMPAKKMLRKKTVMKRG